jgi:hypothetical protein
LSTLNGSNVLTHNLCLTVLLGFYVQLPLSVPLVLLAAAKFILLP